MAAATPLIGQNQLPGPESVVALGVVVADEVGDTLLELNCILSVTTSIFLVDKDSKWRAAIDTLQWFVRFYKD
jgi:hypothetical protein